ncbi:helix-turn-helix domain-containing protein [Eisenbergiella sp.]
MNVKEMRKDKGLTQKQLAEQIGVNSRWVQKLESGEIKLENITFLNAIKLIRALTPYDDEKQLAREMYIIAKRTLQENN